MHVEYTLYCTYTSMHASKTRCTSTCRKQRTRAEEQRSRGAENEYEYEWAHHFFSGMGRGTELTRQGTVGTPARLRPSTQPSSCSGKTISSTMASTPAIELACRMRAVWYASATTCTKPATPPTTSGSRNTLRHSCLIQCRPTPHTATATLLLLLLEADSRHRAPGRPVHHCRHAHW